jgi:hypothetical protein
MEKPPLPEVLRTEHEELNQEIWKATKVGGETGRAAKSVVRVLLPHIVLEEEFGLPPLTLLPRLARGEVTPDMAPMIATAEKLKAELPRLLDDHRQIVQALQNLLQAATIEQQPGYADFARKLILHVQTEEQVLYPASVLVGEYLKEKLGRS